jgi:hypothetical protein
VVKVFKVEAETLIEATEVDIETSTEQVEIPEVDIETSTKQVEVPETVLDRTG